MSDEHVLDKLLHRIWNFVYTAWIIYFSVLFILPYFAYAYFRDECINIVVRDTIYIKELNINAENTPEIDKSGFGLYYDKVHSVIEAEQWLKSNGYKSKEIRLEDGGYRFYFVKPNRNTLKESVVTLLADYGDGKIFDLIAQKMYTINTSIFPQITENLETKEIYEQIDVRKGLSFAKYKNGTEYKIENSDDRFQ
jgi:hypothetical protein